MPDGREFEMRIATRMRALGWQCELTPVSGDFGADLICRAEREVAVIQCKCYDDANSIGVGAVQEACTAASHFKADVGMVIYEGKLTRPAMTLASSVGVKMYRSEELTPGWEYDRTLVGERLRKEEQARRRAEDERTKRETKIAYDNACRAYAKQLQAWEREHLTWVEKSKAWESWRVASILAAVFGSIVLFSGARGDDGLISFGCFIGAAAIYFIKSPAASPVKPEPPDPLNEEGAAQTANPKRRSTTTSPTDQRPRSGTATGKALMQQTFASAAPQEAACGMPGMRTFRTPANAIRNSKRVTAKLFDTPGELDRRAPLYPSLGP